MRKKNGQFTRGHSFSKGRPRISDAERSLRQLGLEDLRIVFNNIGNMSVSKLKTHIASGEATPLEAVLGRQLLSGTPKQIERLFDRLFGKV